MDEAHAGLGKQFAYMTLGVHPGDHPVVNLPSLIVVSPEDLRAVTEGFRIVAVAQVPRARIGMDEHRPDFSIWATDCGGLVRDERERLPHSSVA